MKVIRDTPTQLIVENTPWMFAIMLGIMALIAFATAFILLFSGSLVGGILVGLVSAVIFPFTLYYVVQRVQIIFDTPTNTMKIRKRTLLRYTTIAHDLHHLSHAELDTNIDSDDSTQTHCPIFVLSGGMSAGRHKMTPTHQSGHGPKRIVDAVNQWLNAARQNGHITPPVDSTPPTP
jgi:hypothetical protein